ncbi:hypothetical protein E5P55_01290 [Candidatus Pinguicoccus supinus]|uniref:Uncharacterized protein n=1 Tax=Candidatus Pinguicoccus supinus TaxID=2529394 RepID=A0A7T0BS16_9BACT|nr:hypothetical protein E5P55_01290 [Candidatus Pinguicoccus supinus]
MVKNNLFINLGGTIILNIIVGKLKTFRGTGRFTREVIKNIIIKNTNKINFNKKNVYYFYSSVDIVPTREIIKNRCLVVVHDVTPLILYKKFNLKKIKQWFFRYSYVINNS